MTALIRLFAGSVLMLMALFALPAFAEHEEDLDAISPLRLSYLDGDVGFWRNGAEDWTDARLNTPLAAGDALYVDGDGTLELQLSSRAFIRASDNSQLSVVNQTADFLQVKVASGRVSFDLRTLPSGYAIELNTPNSVFTIERPGYYRVDVDDNDVRFITRRGGEAVMVPAGGSAMSIYPSEETVVEGTTMARAETSEAPEMDSWDRWNNERTEDIIEAASQRYLSSDIAGAEDLDRYGRWRSVPEYGTVWVPQVAVGWAPYSTGRWVYDPYYQWTWIDDAPWGWAPFHYGRWVYVGNYWAWAPGPVVRRAAYSPALVAFYGVGSSASLTIGGSLGWVALSWGEPVVPWWGRSNFVGRPYWGGWGGPRVVNNVVINNTTNINVTNIQYVNTRVNNAFVAVPGERFGRGYVQPSAISAQKQQKTLLRGALPIKPAPASVTIGSPGKVRVPEKALNRPVVATRLPREHKLPWGGNPTRGETQLVQPGAQGERTRPNMRGKEQFITVPKPDKRELGRPQRAGEERPQPPQRYNERRESSPELENRVREQREKGGREEAGREAKPLREFKQFKEPTEPQRPDAPRQDARDIRPAVPEALPRMEREDVPDRLRGNEPERRSVAPERDRPEPRAVERREAPPPPPFENRVREQREKERREPRPSQEFKEFRGSAEPQRFDAPPPRQDVREVRPAMPEALPRTEPREERADRVMRNREPERQFSAPERERPEPRAIERREQPPAFENRVREQERREPRPSQEFKEFRGSAEPQRFDAPPPRQDVREVRPAMPEALPRTEPREERADRVMRNREPERQFSAPERERSEPRIAERREPPRESAAGRFGGQERRELMPSPERMERRHTEVREAMREAPGNVVSRMPRGAEKKQDAGQLDGGNH